MNEEHFKDMILQEEILASWENYQQNIQESVPSTVIYDSVPGLNQADLNKESGLKKGKHTIAVGNNKSNYDDSKDYPLAYPAKHIGADPDLFADDYIKNDKIVRKAIVAGRSQIGKSYVGEVAEKYHVHSEGDVKVSYPGAVYAMNMSDSIALSGKSIYTQGKVLSEDELRVICNIKRDSFVEFENKAINRRYSVS